MKTITIIGAGLSGTLLSMNLLKKVPDQPLVIHWIDRNSERDMGPAYSTNEDYLLNVPVELMGAFSNDSEHFLVWAQKKNIKTQRGDFLPRKWYKEYIQEMWQEAWMSKVETIRLQRMRDEVTNVAVQDKQIKVFLQKSPSFYTDKIVFAFGNSLPRNPQFKNKAIFCDEHYVQDPWQPKLLDRMSKDDTIFFIGTGQTMVDLATGLYRRNHKGRMVAISRRGVLPMSQKKVDSYPSFYDEIKEYDEIIPVFHTVRKHIKLAKDEGLDPRAVIDSLRSHTSEIWMKFPPEEKTRFLRHVFRYWEIIRSRIPPLNERIINELIKKGQLEIFTGRIVDMRRVGNAFQVEYIDRKSKSKERQQANFVVNCIGPTTDFEKIENGLIKNLIDSKTICCDPAHLGINALPDGNILTAENEPSDNMFTLGPTLKGIVWESLATPEIRVQAEYLSRILIADN